MSLDFEILKKLIIPLLLGTLVGLEREHHAQQRQESHFAGIRTFGLFAFLGAISEIFFADSALFWILALFAAFLIGAGYFISSWQKKTLGATTELAALGIYLMGIIAGRGDFLIATILTLIILLLLYLRNPLHHLASKINKEELLSTIEFIVIAFIILPLLPNKSFGPFDVLNPYIIWLMVVLVSGISFVSYIAMKLLGPKRGIGVTGFFAGFVSSTALALSFSQESKKRADIINPFVFALLVASSAMFFRVLFLLAVLYRPLFHQLLLPLGVMGITGFLLAWFYWRKKESLETPAALSSHVEKLRSPFTLLPALKFGAAFAAILFISKVALQYAGTTGIYTTSFLSGILDVDAITVSLANLAKNGISEKMAGIAIFLAASTNTLSKGAIFALFGNWKVARTLLLGFGIILLAGAIALAVPV